MHGFSRPLEQLIEELKRIPGIGRKSAQRIAFFLMKADPQVSRQLASTIREARESLTYCSICNNITTEQPCEICADPNREKNRICVVEEPFNIVSIERTGLFRGLYHVLLGNLSPIHGIGPDELKISGLVQRIAPGGIEEIILATSPTIEGNATAHYLTEILREYKILITRIALGIPIGADLDYTDQVTIAQAIAGRRQMQ